MRSARIFFDNDLTGYLIESEDGKQYRFQYEANYNGPPISLTMQLREEVYLYDEFPPFFDGLLPEGFQLNALLRQKKIDQNDKFSQLLIVGADTVGAVTIKEGL